MIVAEFAFPSGPLEPQHNLPVPPYFPSTKLEMILIYFPRFDTLNEWLIGKTLFDL